MPDSVERLAGYDADGNEIIVNDSIRGKAMAIERDETDVVKQGTYYREDGITPYFMKDGKGNAIYYREDGITPDFMVDKYGNETHYREDGKTPAFMVDKQGNGTYYREDGKTPDFMVDEQGNETHYREDGKTVDFVIDSNRLVTKYKEDGKTIDYTLENVYEDGKCIGSITRRPDGSLRSVKSPNGDDEVFYKEDGKTMDYAFHHGAVITYDDKEKAVAGMVVSDKEEVKIVDAKKAMKSSAEKAGKARQQAEKAMQHQQQGKGQSVETTGQQHPQKQPQVVDYSQKAYNERVEALQRRTLDMFRGIGQGR